MPDAEISQFFNPPTKENIPAYSREKAFMKCCEDKKISGRVVYTDRLAPLSEEFGNNIFGIIEKKFGSGWNFLQQVM